MALGGTLLGVVLDLIGILFSTSGNLLMRWVANRFFFKTHQPTKTRIVGMKSASLSTPNTKNPKNIWTLCGISS